MPNITKNGKDTIKYVWMENHRCYQKGMSCPDFIVILLIPIFIQFKSTFLLCLFLSQLEDFIFSDAE